MNEIQKKEIQEKSLEINTKIIEIINMPIGENLHLLIHAISEVMAEEINVLDLKKTDYRRKK